MQIREHPPRPMTSRQAKAEYRKYGPRMSSKEYRQLQRDAELYRRAEEIKNKERRRKEAKLKKQKKAETERENRKRMGIPDPGPKVSASQPLLFGFLKPTVEMTTEEQLLEKDSGADGGDLSSQIGSSQHSQNEGEVPADGIQAIVSLETAKKERSSQRVCIEEIDVVEEETCRSKGASLLANEGDDESEYGDLLDDSDFVAAAELLSQTSPARQASLPDREQEAPDLPSNLDAMSNPASRYTPEHGIYSDFCVDIGFSTQSELELVALADAGQTVKSSPVHKSAPDEPCAEPASSDSLLNVIATQDINISFSDLD